MSQDLHAASAHGTCPGGPDPSVAGAERAWAELAGQVPLTGREPILGRLRPRLAPHGAGGWLAVSGPPGAGVTRVLLEALSAVRGGDRDGPPARAPLWIAPCETGAPRLESLRRALLPWWRSGPDAALLAALQGVVPSAGGGAPSLLRWLAAGPLAAGDLVPPLAVLRASLLALGSGSVLCADDWGRLDEATRRLLTEVSAERSLGVLVGWTTSDEVRDVVTPGPVWPLEPLAESQVELLLRRWLRSSVVARRLMQELSERCGGWPGRVVAVVRALARDGCLRPTPRGWALDHWPRSWAPFERVWELPADALPGARGGPAAERVYEAASLAPEPHEPELLAETAGVKRALVDQLVQTSFERRHGHALGRLFSDESARREALLKLRSSRRTQACLRLAQVWSRRPRPLDRGVGDALARLSALLESPEDFGLAEALTAALGALGPIAQAAPPVLDLVERASQRVADLAAAAGREASAANVLLAAARWLATQRHAAAGALLARCRPVAGAAHEVPWLGLALRHGLAPDRAHAQARLEHVLESADGLDPAAVHAAWRALAEAPQSSLPLRRRAWREALARVPSCDVAARAALHGALAESAEARGRLRAAAAHGRRSARLLSACGDLAGSAAAHHAVGLREVRLAHLGAARVAFEAAAAANDALGDPVAASECLALEAEAAGSQGAHDEAVPLLEAALARAADGGSDTRLSSLHLALVRAHRSRGDLPREREHALAAEATALRPEDRLAARAAWLSLELRSGVQGAAERLSDLVGQLEAAGMREEAARGRCTLLDERLRAGDVAGARSLGSDVGTDPVARLAGARLLRLTGKAAEAMAALEAVGRDATVPAELRAEAYARLAELQCASEDVESAGRTAQAASALLEVPHRGHAHDPRLYRLLSRVYRDVGARARSVEHRAAARRTLRLPPLSEVGAEVRRRIARSLWMDDPRPSRRTQAALAS